MTLPFERYRAVISTERFLLELCDPKKTPKVPKDIRRQAAHLLRHYPTVFDMDTVAQRENSSIVPRYQVFSKEFL